MKQPHTQSNLKIYSNARDSKKEFQDICTFFDQEYSSNRVITSLDWNPNVTNRIFY